jgi:hypothetical protein
MSNEVLSALRIELGLIPEADLAVFRDIELPALRNERARGEGPPYVKLGRAVFYPIEGLRKYAAAQTVIPTQAGATLIDGGRANKRRSRPESTPAA